MCSAQVHNRRRGTQIQTHAFHVNLGCFVDLFPIDKTGLRKLVHLIQDNILRDRAVRDQVDLLIDDADTVADRIAVAFQLQALIIQPDLAAVRLIDPADDFHKRTFSCTVFTE